MPTTCLPAIFSQSLGCNSANHDLKSRFQAAAKHRISGIELFYGDLEAVASSLHPEGCPTPSAADLIRASHEIRNLADSLGLKIIDLQPFMHYEGLISRTSHAAAIERAKLWLQLTEILGTDLILISSSFLPKEECTGDFATIVRDVTELADLGKEHDPPVRFAYENLCWGTYVNSWQGMHAVVQAVNRWNFGYCMDTFNIAGLVYGNPSAPDGKAENAEEETAESLSKMVQCVDREKIFLVQMADAEQMSRPITPDHPWYDASSQPSSRMPWSRNARLFPLEEKRGAYLPVMDVLKALLQGLGYRGWVSFELFSRTLSETAEDVPDDHAARAQRSWGKLVEAFPDILVRIDE